MAKYYPPNRVVGQDKLIKQLKIQGSIIISDEVKTSYLIKLQLSFFYDSGNQL